MAQQTINVGSAPNDGTGTPLRTAFQYTNSNFSELYTAVGPSGNNIVVPGTATITGDLTVDTSTLKVDSTNNRVTVGTTSAYGRLTVGVGSGLQAGTTTNVASGLYDIDYATTGDINTRFSFVNSNGVTNAAIDRIGNPNFNDNGNLAFLTRLGAGSLTERYRIASDGIATWSNVGGVAGTAMTLNSTGLGVGTSPTSKLTIGTAAYAAGTLSGTTSLYSTVAQGLVVLADGFNISTRTGSDRFTLDTSGNVGIGVTPSAWAAGYKAIQGQIGGFALSNDNSSNNQFRLSSNAYFDTTDNRWEYFGTSTATAYEQRAGEHRFFNAISGSANTAITFTQAMTLDASGRLLVGKTTSGFTTVGAEIRENGEVIQTIAASTDATLASKVYSSTAAAYRFYVGLGGTVFATNTTISAISDARLKENVQDIDVGLGAILALKPRKFDWKAGKGKDIKGDRGFIAQEFEQVFPQLVDEWADPAPEGEAPYKSVRQDLIPVLVKAIQELTARVQTLEAK